MHQITQIAEVICLAASVLTSLPLIRHFLPVQGLGFIVWFTILYTTFQYSFSGGSCTVQCHEIGGTGIPTSTVLVLDLSISNYFCLVTTVLICSVSAVIILESIITSSKRKHCLAPLPTWKQIVYCLSNTVEPSLSKVVSGLCIEAPVGINTKTLKRSKGENVASHLAQLLIENLLPIRDGPSTGS